ncbi:MAG: type II secretion system F family protein [Gemmataceae bacterium]|nr:type II secretion system F family protein [Gemmataceae bacterium]MDW8264910.1 type II secretion system F family protein [Gemmataceae bacterium]
MAEWGWLILLFCTVTVVTFLIVHGVQRAAERARRRLASTALDSGPGTVPERQFLGPLTSPLADLIPISASGRADLLQELRAAGYYSPTALTDFLAFRAVLVLVSLVATEVAALFVPTAHVLVTLLIGLIITGLTYSVPRLIVVAQGRRRARQIERGLPLAVDLITMCLSAGQNILFALNRVSRELRYANPVLSEELEIVRQQAELRSTEHALQQLAERVAVPGVRNLALILVQSERLGTDSAAALQEFADNLRITLRQRAEAQGNRISFWMLFPTILCFLTAAGIVLVGPAYQEFRRGLNETLEQARRARQEIERANPEEVQILRGPPTAPTANGR